MFGIYKITYAGKHKHGTDLIGLLIAQTDDGFYIVDPEPRLEAPIVLASTKLYDFEGHPLAEFKFPLKEQFFTLKVDFADRLEMGGKWDHKDAGQEPDSWTATGTSTGTDGDEEVRAASASS